jgi:hypothetical protein
MNILHVSILNGPTQFFSVSQRTPNIIEVPCSRNFAIRTFPVPEKNCLELSGRQRLLNIFGSFDESVCIRCFDCSLVSKFKNKT